MNQLHRCGWVTEDPLYQEYHDREWGVPVTDDHKMFAFLLLESFQAGLSWLTILRKRENFRKAFADFDCAAVARMDQKDETRLMQDAGIVRNRSKIRAAIANAQQCLRIKEEKGSLCQYFWDFVDGRPIQNKWQHLSEVPATTPLAESISRDLKKRGFLFVGSTVIYAHMQACGMVNDHLSSCFRFPEIAEMQKLPSI